MYAAATPFPFYTERYFTKYVAENQKKIAGNNYTLLTHSNSLLMLCIDPTHDVHTKLTEGAGNHMLRIRFVTPDGMDRLDQVKTVSGKHKRNALRCMEGTLLGVIEIVARKRDDDGDDSTSVTVLHSYPIPACSNGTAIELNENVLADPMLALRDPFACGYIAILNPSAPYVKKIIPEKYKMVAQRQAHDTVEEEE